MPRPMMALLCTKTHPTGVSFVSRATSACLVGVSWGLVVRLRVWRDREGKGIGTIARASRMKFKCISFSCSVIISDDLEVEEGGGDDGPVADIV